MSVLVVLAATVVSGRSFLSLIIFRRKEWRHYRLNLVLHYP